MTLECGAMYLFQTRIIKKKHSTLPTALKLAIINDPLGP
jgi:hypothetical protein